MIFIDEHFCKGCGICVRLCPKHVLEISDQVNRRGYYVPRVRDAEACTECRNCDLSCPDFAIFLREAGKRKRKAAGRKNDQGGDARGEAKGRCNEDEE